MKRRNFIKKSILNIGALAISPALLEACKADGADYDKTVIVIGAGISGLSAALKLKEKGFTVKVLEAQEKVGGRLRSNRSLGIAFDEGASWIHGITGNPISSLAQKAGMTTFHTDDSSILAYDLGGVLRSDYEQMEAAFYDVLETLMDQGSSTKSFETVFLE